MAIRDIFKVSRKTFVNPKAWLNWDAFKTSNQIMGSNLKKVFTIPEPLRTETFDEAMQRFGLTESDIQFKIHRFRLYALTFVLLALIAFMYAFYLLFRYGTFTGFLLGIAVCGLLCSQAFRFDFWSLQLRRRQLGLTFQDWQDSVLGKKDVNP